MAIFDRETVLKKSKGGPFGFGDPDDRELLPVEKLLVIPVYKRDIILQNYCSKLNYEYNVCCQNQPWSKKFSCRRENSSLKSCLKQYWSLPHVKEQAENEYLKERSVYRLTGLKKSERDELLNQSSSNQEKN